MRLLTFCLVLVLFMAIATGVYGNAAEQPLSLYDVEPQGHENEGARLARQYGHHGGHGGYGGHHGGHVWQHHGHHGGHHGHGYQG